MFKVISNAGNGFFLLMLLSILSLLRIRITLLRIRILLYTLMRILIHPTFYSLFSDLDPRMPQNNHQLLPLFHFDPTRIFISTFDADPDPASQNDADPDSQYCFLWYQLWYKNSLLTVNQSRNFTSV
jgi:hypothetical protein